MTRASLHSYDLTCDVLVVGSGAAGLSAAVTAADRGREVLVLERHARIGGTSAISGGWLYVPGNPFGSARTGDTREEFLRYLRGLAGEAVNTARVTEFLDAVPRMIRFFTDQTDLEFVDPTLAPDYRMLVPGSRESGRSLYAKPVNARTLGPERLRLRTYKRELTVLGVMPQIGPDLQEFLHANVSARSFAYVLRRILRNWGERLIHRRGLDLSNGNALIGRLVTSALARGVTIRTATMVSRLVVEDGAVTGAVASGPDGDVRIHARAGVVLAAGGFSHDPAQRADVFPSSIAADHHVSPMTAEHDGASLRLAEQAGGYLDRSVVHPAAWASVSVFERGRTFPHLRGVGLPGIIAVNAHGERFVNEANSYHDFGPALLASAGDDVRAFLIADARTMHRYGLGYAKPWPMPRLRYRLGGYLHSGRTLDVLARRIGVDPQRLTRTVREFNRDAATGIDSVFGRGVGAFNLFKGDPDNKPNPTLRALSKGPYYATEVRIGDLGTFAGIATGRRGRVLRRDGTPVPGLYAVGSAAVSVFGGSYPGAGAHLGPAMTFGYLAGLDLAARRTDPAPADDTPAQR